MSSNVTSKFALKSKKQLFWPTRCFRCFCCVVGVAFVVLQDLGKREMLLPNFTIFIRRLVKKLFHFEVTFRWGGGFISLQQCNEDIGPSPLFKKVAWIRSKTNCFKKKLYLLGEARGFFSDNEDDTVSHDESVSFEILYIFLEVNFIQYHMKSLFHMKYCNFLYTGIMLYSVTSFYYY